MAHVYSRKESDMILQQITEAYHFVYGEDIVKRQIYCGYQVQGNFRKKTPVTAENMESQGVGVES